MREVWLCDGVYDVFNVSSVLFSGDLLVLHFQFFNVIA